MENKELNLVEILKDCPKGTKLYSTIYGEVEFDEVDCRNGVIYPICFYKDGILQCVNENGLHLIEHDGECTLFPSKDNRDWSTFRIPFRDGDIVTYDDGDGNVKVFIFNEYTSDVYAVCYVAYFGEKALLLEKSTYGYRINRLATEEEKAKLFQAIKDNGYKWNQETKTLENLVEPKFHKGDRIRHKSYTREEYIVTEIKDTHYILDDESALPFIGQDDYELVPNKFDITTLQPFDKVLVRDDEYNKWQGDFFLYKNGTEPNYPYTCICSEFRHCIPYNDDTKHLLGTSEDAPEYYRV